MNELLCFMVSQFDKLDRQNLSTTLLEFYSKNEVISAKEILVSHCEDSNVSNAINPLKKKRIGTDVEQKVVKDILDIWEIVDSEKGGQLCTKFVAIDPNRLPSVMDSIHHPNT